MKLANKLLAVLCTAFLAVNVSSVLASAETSAENTPVFDSSNIAVSFGAISDVHIEQTSTDKDAKFSNALSKFKDLAGGSENLDAVVIAGDLFDAAPDKEAPRCMEIFKSCLNPDDTEVIPAVGNHDYYFDQAFIGKNKFQDAFGPYVYKKTYEKSSMDDVVWSANYHTVINGIHFIAVTGYDGDHDSMNLSWLTLQLKYASEDNPKLPIVVITHSPPADTMYGSGQVGRFQSTTIGPILEMYPQVVIFAGHTHSSAIQDSSVWQGRYTAVGTGSIRNSADFVQIDKNGVVKITPYNTSIQVSGMKEAHAPWVFKPKEAIYKKASVKSTNTTVEAKQAAVNLTNNRTRTYWFVVIVVITFAVMMVLAELAKKNKKKNQ